MQTGDIGAVRGTNWIAKLNRNLVCPFTDRFHFFLLGDFIQSENDWVILESIDKGVTVGRLSWYEDVEFYRTTYEWNKHIGEEAAKQATKHGRVKYDYLLYVYIFWYGIRALIKNFLRIHKFVIYYSDIPNIKNKRLICTELIAEAYRDLFEIFDDRYEATPSNFMQAIKEGRVIKIENPRID